MSAPKFTPGPWKVSESSRAPIIDADDQEIISACGCCDGISARSEDLYLLAAAPELFAALRDAESEFDGAVRFYRNEMAGFVGASIVERLEACARKARAALRKAEGGAT